MINSPFRFARPPAVTVEVAPANDYAVLTSMALLTAPGPLPIVDPWVGATAARLTPAERERNRLVFEAFGTALMVERDHASFDAYLGELAALAPSVLRDHALRRLVRPAPSSASAAAPTPQALLGSVELYLGQLALLEPDAPVDEELQRKAHALLGDPPALHDLIVSHLRAIWATYVAPEWTQQQQFRSTMVQLLREREWPTVTAIEAIRSFIGRELPPAISAQLEGVRHVVLSISPHVGPFAARYGSPDTVWVFVRARANLSRPKERPTLELPLRQAPIKRAELIGPFSALSDDTRLQILELLAAGELSAQQIIGRLDLSQSGISRHLKQLVGSGFVEERRGDGANKLYQLNEARIDWVFYALRQLLAQAPAPAETPPAVERPLELQRFVNGDGKVAAWPSRRRDQLLVLDYIAAQFKVGRSYSEREVNELIDGLIARLTRPATTNRGDNVPIDYVTVRRELFEARLIRRTPDGARYWREEESGEHENGE